MLLERSAGERQLEPVTLRPQAPHLGYRLLPIGLRGDIPSAGEHQPVDRRKKFIDPLGARPAPR